MATLNIDDETFEALHRQAAARGLSVEDWLKRTMSGLSAEHGRAASLSVQERLQRFDQLSGMLNRMQVSSGGMLDDSRETIYGDRGLS